MFTPDFALSNHFGGDHYWCWELNLGWPPEGKGPSLSAIALVPSVHDLNACFGLGFKCMFELLLLSLVFKKDRKALYFAVPGQSHPTNCAWITLAVIGCMVLPEG